MSTLLDRPRPRAFHPQQADVLGTGREAPGWDLGPERRIDDGVPLARALGWFSLGLGAAEILAPGWFARTLALDDRETLVRAYGVREIASGVGLLRGRRPTTFAWSRVAGDALDLATLAAAWRRAEPARRRNVALAIAAVAGVTALDVLCATRLASTGGH